MSGAPEGTDTETGEIAPTPDVVRMPWDPFTPEQAEDHTCKITATAKQLCMLITEAHEGKAHTALGYATWGEYVADRLDISRSRSYQLLAKGRLAMMSAGVVGLPVSTVVDTVPEGASRGIGTDQLRQVLTDALLALGPNPSTADRLGAIESAIDTLRGEVREAKKQAAEAKAKPAPVDPDADAMSKAAAAANRAAAKTSDDGAPLAVSDEPGVHPPVVPGSTPHGAVSEPRTDAPAADTDGTGLASHADGADGGAASSSAAAPPSLPDDLSDGELADVIEIAAWLGDTVPAAIAAAAAEADHGDPATVAALALIDQWVTDYVTARQAIKEHA